MEIDTRPVEAGDLEMLAGWWSARGESPPDAAILPPLGFISFDAAGAGGCGFVYVASGCPVAYMEFVATRPGLSAADARRHLLAVLARAESHCRDFGIRGIGGATSDRAIARELARAGFCEVSRDLRGFWKTINHPIS